MPFLYICLLSFIWNLRISKILEWPWIVTQHESIYSNKVEGRETGLVVAGIGETEGRAPEMTDRQERLFLTKSVLKSYLEWKTKGGPLLIKSTSKKFFYLI